MAYKNGRRLREIYPETFQTEYYSKTGKLPKTYYLSGWDFISLANDYDIPDNISSFRIITIYGELDVKLTLEEWG